MHIDSKPNSEDGHLMVLQYDAEAQASFAKAQASAEEIWRDPKIRKVTEPHGKLFLDRVMAGLKVLQLLSQSTARSIELPEYDLQASFEAAVLTSEAGIAVDKDVSSFPEVIVLLARVTTHVPLLFHLPPASEVFNRDEVSQDVWDGFESMRRKTGVALPRLSFFQFYQIWFALSQMRPTNWQLQSLLQYLDQVTGTFRSAMENQALSVVLGRPAKKSRNKRKS